MENLKKSYWMWHFGDFEIYHNMLLNFRRQELGADVPPFWNICTPHPNVEFYKDFVCEKEGYFTLIVNGAGCVSIDGKRYRDGEKIAVSKGEHKVKISVMKSDGLPCAYVESDVCPSDGSWECTHVTSQRFPVGTDGYYDDKDKNPEIFHFEYEPVEYVSKEKAADGVLYDFGKEMFGKITLENVSGECVVSYGESREEALSGEAILYEKINKSTTLVSRAFRYIFLKGSLVEEIKISADYEYLPLEYKGKFECSNDLMNRIWDVSAYTFHLNSREFFLDGIKRDRWVWSGDAYQSYMVNNYLFFDKEISKRTILALRGQDYVEQHINTILDYSLYWIISVYDYYYTFKDLDFVKAIYPRVKIMMDFCENRLNSDGFIVDEGKNMVDWAFVDWSDIDKTGAVCAEQMLLYKAYITLATLGKITDNEYEEYSKKAEILKENINKFYWNDEKKGFIDSYESGKNQVSRHSNIFAIMFDIATDEQRDEIIENVLKNDSITQITTPYFKFYELLVLSKVGMLDEVTDFIKYYWGGMLNEGATSIWEAYDPGKTGAEHYQMYEETYDKSLCHAWGAGPVYLLGRFYMGVSPTSAGYETFKVEPKLGGLKSLKGSVPINGGEVVVEVDSHKLEVTATKDGGVLIWNNREYPLPANEKISIDL